MSATSITSSPHISAMYPPSAGPTSMPARLARSSSSSHRIPAQVQTRSLPPSSISLPASAISVSSVTSSSVQASPVMSPDTTQLTTKNSSLQPSPDALHGRDGDVPPPPFELPESLVSHKASQTALSEAFAASKSPGLMRRLSNRAASKLPTRHRQPSVTSRGRENSTGPILRRRSDSTNTAPDTLPRGGPITDSDSDLTEDLRECLQIGLGIEGTRAYSASLAASMTGSLTSTPATPVAPTIPTRLLQGTRMLKISKKKKKLLTFVLENEARVTWDKSRPHKSFAIDDIKAIRVGCGASPHQQECDIAPSEAARFFTICYAIPDRSKERLHKVMHLVAEDDQAVELWTTTLDAISRFRQERAASRSGFDDETVRRVWRQEIAKQSPDRAPTRLEAVLDFNGFQDACRHLHIHCSAALLRERLVAMDVKNTSRITFLDFRKILRTLRTRDDVSAIYHDITKERDRGMTRDEFLAFLRDFQHETMCSDKMTTSTWDTVFGRYAQPSLRDDDTLDLELPRMSESAFTCFMASQFCSPVDSAPAHYSLDRPLNEYFISSSHNTYLVGRQVVGHSSTEAYITALNRGCRCVEVDCWDGSDGQPVVNHGRTLTTSISFADVMATISRYAFQKSPFPLWVSLEVHCSAPQQETMARIIKDTCGAALVTKPLDDRTDVLPSPSQLLHRILVKVKKPHAPVEVAATDAAPSGRSRGNSLNAVQVRPALLDHNTVPLGSLPTVSAFPRTPRSLSRRTTGLDSLESPSSNTSDSEGLDGPSRLKDGERAAKASIVKVLGDLGVYSAGTKFDGFEHAESKKYNHIFSFAERTFHKHSKSQEDKRALTRHNMRYLMRVYPNAFRFNSSNFDPMEYWRRGVQMVALNWQTYDLGMQINDAMFAAGAAQSGYVLKPVELREIQVLTSVPEEAGANHTKRERKRINFSIDVISAQQLMRPKSLNPTRSVDPYIEIEVFHADDKSKQNPGVVGEGGLDASNKDGFSGLGAPHRRRTQIVPGNAFNPVFNRKLNFSLTTKQPDLVFVRFSVRYSPDGSNYSDKGQPLATYCAKLHSLKQGYRTLRLYDTNGEEFLFSTLFCHIRMDPVTSIYIDEPAATTSSASTGGIKGFGRNVWNRTPMSPRQPSSEGPNGS